MPDCTIMDQALARAIAVNPVAVLSRLLSVDKGVAKVVLAGLGVLAAAAIVISWQIDVAVAGRIALIILLFSIAVTIVAIVCDKDGAIAHVLAWFFTAIFIGYTLLLVIQFVCNSCFSPPVPRLPCLINPMQKGCQAAISASLPVAPSDGGTSAGEDADNPEVSAAGDTTAGGSPAVGVTDRQSEIFAPPEGHRVYIHFAGAVSREAVQGLSSELAGEGWNVEGRAERLSSAYGLNEVRYFHEEDEEAAIRLAEAISKSRPTGEEISTRFLPDSPARDGHLEVWFSRR